MVAKLWSRSGVKSNLKGPAMVDKLWSRSGSKSNLPDCLQWFYPDQE
jgi:hypothetical protein